MGDAVEDLTGASECDLTGTALTAVQTLETQSWIRNEHAFVHPSRQEEFDEADRYRFVGEGDCPDECPFCDARLTHLAGSILDGEPAIGYVHCPECRKIMGEF